MLYLRYQYNQAKIFIQEEIIRIDVNANGKVGFKDILQAAKNLLNYLRAIEIYKEIY